MRKLRVLLILAAVGAAGCQTWTGGMTLPSGKYLEQPQQPLPPTPGFPLAKDQERVRSTPLATPDSTSASTGKNPARVPIRQIEDFTLKHEGLTINNFCLAEITKHPEGQATLRLSASSRNRGEEARSFTLMVTGLTETQELLWACNVEGHAKRNNVELLKETLLTVPPGTLQQTATIALRLHVRKDPSAVDTGANLQPASGVAVPIPVREAPARLVPLPAPAPMASEHP